MKNIKKNNILPKLPDNCNHHFDHALFLDLETTGFSGTRNRLYLIGTAYIENCALCTEQFFADSLQEEPQLIAALDQLAKRFDTIVTFHGSRFDLPFLEKCRNRLQLASADNDSKHLIDLYELARSYRHIFGLENYKQKTLEQFLGISRKDRYSGGELVEIYQSYTKQPNKQEQEQLLAPLLLHNADDLTGMVRLLQLFDFDLFFQGGFTLKEHSVSDYRKLDGSCGKELSIICSLDSPLPAAVSCNNGCFYLHAAKEQAVLRVPLLEGTLKYFYPNYQDYYYLIEEDTAVHKSVAAFVEAAHRRKAKAAECFSKKTGVFVPQYEEIVTPALYTEYKAPVSYFEWTERFEQDDALFKQFCLHMLTVLKKGISFTAQQ